MKLERLAATLAAQFWARMQIEPTGALIACPSAALAGVCDALFTEHGCGFAGLIVEERDGWTLHYLFYNESGIVQVVARSDRPTFPSISARVHAADWHERAAEDLFGITFSGHPRLGEFVLHEQWPEGTNPMRRGFDVSRPAPRPGTEANWEPPRVLHAPGAFSMPIGPIFSGVEESVHFQLETVGEEIVRVIPRLFYKYRGVEAIARGRTIKEALLLAERFTGTSSFAHAVAFSRAVERTCGVTVPPRAERLRAFLAELERLRHHAATIHGICSSTGLAVAASQAAILEEELLRLSGELTGHRYLFGLAVPGGLQRNLTDASCREAAADAGAIARRLDRLEQELARSSSFLDRLERVGIVTAEEARWYGLVGPVARASGIDRDMRVALPYGGYAELGIRIAREGEGDGYARLRILFAEARESARLLRDIAADLPDGGIRAPVRPHVGEGIGWVEAPGGAAVHWVRLAADGAVAEWRILPPSFANWHGFHLAAEGFAFQDFPIILATFGLSAAENDR